jgi:hypothetical protein
MSVATQISWFRIFAESVAIVTSILLAFAIDAWWTDRSERVRTDELLQALETEWSTEITKIDSNLANYDRILSATIELVDAHESENIDLTAEQAVTIIQNAHDWTTHKSSISALNVLLDYGLDHIDDPILRSAIVAWPSVLAEVAPEEDSLQELALMRTRTQLARIAQNLGTPWLASDDGNPHFWFGADAGERALAMIADEEYIRGQRQLVNMLGQYQRQLGSVRATLKQNLDLLRDR